MARYTRPKDEFECRIIEGCGAEEWMYDLFGEYPVDVCSMCPFKNIINHLAELEDEFETVEDDGR